MCDFSWPDKNWIFVLAHVAFVQSLLRIVNCTTYLAGLRIFIYSYKEATTIHLTFYYTFKLFCNTTKMIPWGSKDNDHPMCVQSVCPKTSKVNRHRQARLVYGYSTQSYITNDQKLMDTTKFRLSSDVSLEL